MTFGFEGRGSRRRALLTGAALLSALVVAAVSGCGGGGGGPVGPTPTPDPSRSVPVFGQLLDVGTGLPVSGAVISFNGANAVTDTNGNFSVPAAPTTASQNVSVVTPTGTDGLAAYHSTVVYQNKIYNSGSFPIVATLGKVSFDVKQIYVANISYPPFPPDF